jgi:hypothetical protein
VLVEVVVDNDILAEHTLGVGETRAFDVDIADGFRMELRVDSLSCSDGTAVWIEPTIFTGSEQP